MPPTRITAPKSVVVVGRVQRPTKLSPRPKPPTIELDRENDEVMWILQTLPQKQATPRTWQVEAEVESNKERSFKMTPS